MAALVRPGSTAADVGCDHGKLAAYLAASGRCPKVYATDLRPGPLAVAQATCAACGCGQKVEFLLGDGLAPLAPGCAQDLVLAGVSAQTTIEILQAAPWVKDPGVRLILAPATKHALLRRWLACEGFALRQDIPVCAGGRWYAVMAAEYTGQAAEPDGFFCLLGRTPGQPGSAGYRQAQLAKLKKQLRGITAPAEREAAVMLVRRLETKGEP